MSEEQQVSSGATDETSGMSQDQSSSVSDTPTNQVSYDTHRKLLGEKKKATERLAALEAELTELREGKMQDEGKKDELIDSLRKRVSEYESKYKKAHADFAYKSVSSQIEREALKAGCVDTEALLSLSDLSTLEVDDNYSVNTDDIMRMIDEAKERRGYLFSKPGPKVVDGVPAKPELSNKKGIEGKSIDELARMLAESKK